MNSLLEGKNFGLEEIVNFLDETAHALQHSQSILNASLENIEQGISVVDKDLQLVAWNTPYVKLFNYRRNFCMSAHPLPNSFAITPAAGSVEKVNWKPTSANGLTT